MNLNITEIKLSNNKKNELMNFYFNIFIQYFSLFLIDARFTTYAINSLIFK